MNEEIKVLSNVQVKSWPDGTFQIQTDDWGTTVRDISEIHRWLKGLEGKVLTLLEASIQDDRQLEALKSVIRQEIVGVYNQVSPVRKAFETASEEQDKRHASEVRGQLEGHRV